MSPYDNTPAFAEEPDTSRSGFRSIRSEPVSLKTLALACIGQLLDPELGPDQNLEHRFLMDAYRRCTSQGTLSQQLQDYLQNPSPEDQGLFILYERLLLDEIELLAIALALAVEIDPMVGRALAYVQAPVGASRPTLGLLESALLFLADGESDSWVGGHILSGMAVRCGILIILNNEAPLPEQGLQLPSALALALRTRDHHSGLAQQLKDGKVILPESIVTESQRQAESLINQPHGVLLIRSASRREARAVAAVICRYLDLVPRFIGTDQDQLQGLGPLCLIGRYLPVFQYDVGPSEIYRISDLPGYDGPRLVITGFDGHVEALSGSLLQWILPLPTRSERETLWCSYLNNQELAARLASNHVHSAGRIKELAVLAEREARLHQRKQPMLEDIRQAAWSAEEGNLGSLAQPITARIPDEALVLPELTRQELLHLMQRCQSREGLEEELGITLRSRYQMGVKALLVGPSGTGKTLAASWIATRLGLPLYRVDLASIVSKYIGETEKNLAALLTRAEQSEIVLLFDEADSLFGKRTDIKDANDRHANSQTNYLLQRIELYKGIVLLTSNSRGRFDPAFTRRLDKVVEFPLPAPEERRALWQAHLGDAHNLSLKHLNQLALASDLPGGYIRNAVLSAAVLAKQQGRNISLDDVISGLHSEYRKLGRQIPAEIGQYQRQAHRNSG